MPNARHRTWALGTLDREVTYRLAFDPEAYRWEVQALEDGPRSAEERADAPAADATTRTTDRPHTAWSEPR